MQVCCATTEDLKFLEQLWVEIFEDSENFARFALSLCKPSEIYLLKENEEIAAMLLAGIEVEAYEKKGFYLYGVATLPNYRGRGFAKHLIQYVIDKRKQEGYDFVITQPAQPSLFEFYKKLGFNQQTYLRTFRYNIKRNLWAVADFDTVTGSRFKEIRDQFKQDEIVHFSKNLYPKFTQYIYTEGGSTVETANGYGLYFCQDDTIIVRELFANSTAHALILLQAIRERTGLENAYIQLSQNSNLFLGEGKMTTHCLLMGLEKEVYANVMFD